MNGTKTISDYRKRHRKRLLKWGVLILTYFAPNSTAWFITQLLRPWDSGIGSLKGGSMLCGCPISVFFFCIINLLQRAWESTGDPSSGIKISFQLEFLAFVRQMGQNETKLVLREKPRGSEKKLWKIPAPSITQPRSFETWKIETLYSTPFIIQFLMGEYDIFTVYVKVV